MRAFRGNGYNMLMSYYFMAVTMAVVLTGAVVGLVFSVIDGNFLGLKAL